MSVYIFMRIFERKPAQYDGWIRIFTRGKLDVAHEYLVSRLKKGDLVLDIGCGTGALSLRAAKKGARVKAIDINPAALEVARSRADRENLSHLVEWLGMSAVELDKEKTSAFDAVMSSLCFSELNQDELMFTLSETARILKSGGLLLVCDEIRPQKLVLRTLNGLLRGILKIVVLMFTGLTTKAIVDLPGKIESVGLAVEYISVNKMGNFMQIVARKPF